MGWVGVGTILAVACCFLYWHPPHTWATPSSPSPISTPDKTPSTSKQEVIKPRDSSEPPVNEDFSSNNVDSAEESQATPKASASVPTLEIPPLHLDGTKAEEPGQRQMNGSAELYANVAKGSSPQPSKASSFSLMPPPPLPRPRPQTQQPQPGTSARLSPSRPNAGNTPRPPPSAASSLRPPPSAASSLRAPPSAASSLRVPPTGRLNNSLTPKPTMKPAPSKRAVLEPGYSPLDWAALKSNPNNNLRGANLPPNLIKVTPSMLKAQNGRKGNDAWTSYQGKVYNITPYLPYHPGGKGELMRGAGKDAAKLFFEVHPWVNWDAILGDCLVGILVSENDVNDTNALDAMD